MGDVRVVHGEMRAVLDHPPMRSTWTTRAEGVFLMHAGKEAKRNGWNGGRSPLPFYAERYGALAAWIAGRKVRVSMQGRQGDRA